MPLALWFRGALRPFVWDHLGSGSFLNRGIVSPEFVRQMLVEHDSGRRDNSQWLWSLLVLELWFRELETKAEACSETSDDRPRILPVLHK